MYIKLNETSHVTDFAFIGNVEGGFAINIELEDEFKEHFRENFFAYRYVDEELVLDDNKVQEQKQEEIQNLKAQKIIQSKQLLAQFLAENPLPSTAHNDTLGFYSATMEKQQLIAGTIQANTVCEQLGLPTSYSWNESGKSCEEWTKEELIQLMLEMAGYVKPIVSKQQHLEESILLLTTLEEVEEFTISYEEFKINNDS